MNTPCPNCPNCRGANALPAFETAPMPVASALLVQSADEARAMPRRPLAMHHCPNCGYLWNAGFDEALIRYDADYEGTQIHSPHFRAYLDALARDWAALWPDARRVIEAGCGQGEFLEALSAHCGAELIGYDPAARAPRAGRAAIRPTLLPDAPDTPDAHADAVLSRMTLEHLPLPGDFIAAKARWLVDGGMLAVQVPNAEQTIRDTQVCELQYEHVGYHSPRSLLALLDACGLRPVALRDDYAGQHLSAFARKPGAALPGSGPSVTALPDPVPASAVAALGRAQAAFGARWNRRLKDEALAGRAIHLWGAGSRATAFGANLPDPGLVSGVIDINPRRAGTFVPGTGWETLAPDRLRGQSRLCVVVMNPVYVDEIATRLSALGADATILAMDA